LDAYILGVMEKEDTPETYNLNLNRKERKAREK